MRATSITIKFETSGKRRGIPADGDENKDAIQIATEESDDIISITKNGTDDKISVTEDEDDYKTTKKDGYVVY